MCVTQGPELVGVAGGLVVRPVCQGGCRVPQFRGCAGCSGWLMARFEIPQGWTAQAYRFALDPSPTQLRALESHCGAARFAFNQMLEVVQKNLDQRAAERSYGVCGAELTPAEGWSLAGLRKTWNQIKNEVAPWWPANSKEAYNSGLDALARALQNWGAFGPGSGRARRWGFRGSRRGTAARGRCGSPPEPSGWRRTAIMWCCRASAGCARRSRPASSRGAWRRGPPGFCRPRCVSPAGAGSARFR